MSKPFNPSPKQAAIFDWVKRGRGSAIVIAVAGSGKSTTMVRALEHLPANDPVLMLAFNKTVGDELGLKIQKLEEETGRSYRNVHAKTFHSLGFAALAYRLNRRFDQFERSDKKCLKIARATWDEDTFRLYGKFCSDLVGFAKGEGVGTSLAANVPETWERLVSHHDLQLDSEEAKIGKAIDLARNLLQKSTEAARGGFIDYNDMLYLPILGKMRLYPNRWVIVDEAQDTNPVRRELAKKALCPGGRLIAVGDPNQSIYGFTGASHDAMDLIRSEFRCIELPLTISYRCPKAVGRIAQQYVPHFEVHENAPEGEVLDLKEPEALALLGPADAVLCRNSAPLVGLAYRLLGQGTACHVLGSEIGKGLVALIDKMEARSVDGLVKKLQTYEQREVQALLEKDEEKKADAVRDKVACIQTFIDNLGENERTLRSLKQKIESLFDDEKKGILTLCTAHKAKGKEWPTVAILEPELMPGRARQEWQAIQEDNLIYVAVTRAQERLIYIETERKSR